VQCENHLLQLLLLLPLGRDDSDVFQVDVVLDQEVYEEFAHHLDLALVLEGRGAFFVFLGGFGVEHADRRC